MILLVRRPISRRGSGRLGIRCATKKPSASRRSSYARFVPRPLRLKNCIARSCRLAASSVSNVPRFRLFPVLGSFFREYSRYHPDLSLRIIVVSVSVSHQCFFYQETRSRALTSIKGGTCLLTSTLVRSCSLSAPPRAPAADRRSVRQ